MDVRPERDAGSQNDEVLLILASFEDELKEIRKSLAQLCRRLEGSPELALQVSDGRLTPQEMRVARLLAEGHSNRVIARRLSLSENTIKAHLRSIYRKLSVDTRVNAAVAVVLRLSGSGTAPTWTTGQDDAGS
jgi:DNA-binding NarL/FixJ family response regulator